MAEVLAELIIAVHRADRPVRRAVDSVLSCPLAGVVVVAHGVSPESLDLPESSRIKVAQCSAGVGRPGVAKAMGLAAATAPFVGILDSDDWYQRGGVDALLDLLTASGADGALAPLEVEGKRLNSPLVSGVQLSARVGGARLPLGARRLNAVRDRLFYRTAPLGLFRREILQDPRYQLRADVETGEDLQASVRLWSDDLDIVYDPSALAYVVGTEGDDRVTAVPRSAKENLKALRLLLAEGEVDALPHREQLALVMKLLRTSILSPVERGVRAGTLSAADLAAYTQVARGLHSAQPTSVEVLTMVDRGIISAVLLGDLDQVEQAVAARDTAPITRRVLPQKPLQALRRESNLRTTLAGKIPRRILGNTMGRFGGKRAGLPAAQPGAHSAQPKKPSLLIISYSTITSDARVLKQVLRLREQWHVTTCGFGDRPQGADEHIRLPDAAHNLRLYGRYITAKQYRLAYWRQDAVDASWQALQGGKYDAVLANEVDSVPVALRLQPGWGILADLHEYYPALHEQDRLWAKRIKPYYEWLCQTYLPRANKLTTVSPGLADKYEYLVGIKPRVVTNATPYVDMNPTPVHRPLRLVHHGAALRGRGLELLIDAAAESTTDLTLDLFLMPNDPAYVQELTERAAGTRRINVHPGVEYRELVATLNKFDVGFYVLEPDTTNHRYALPNKFFDFVQARLALVVGPSVEMAHLVRRFDLGVVAGDFSRQAATNALDQLTHLKVTRWKENASRHARALSALPQVEVWAECLEAIKNGS